MKKIVTGMLVLTLMGLSLHAAKLRSGQVEFYFAPQYIASKTLQFSEESTIDFHERLGWSFGLGYNIDEHFEGIMLFTNSNGSYNAKSKASDGISKTVSENMYSHTMTAEATYNILKGAFTPYLSANVGIAFIDTGVLDKGEDYEKHYSYRELSYGGSAGLRYDFEKTLYIKGA